LPLLLGGGALLGAVAGGVFYLGGPEAALARLQGLTGGEPEVAEIPSPPEAVTQPPLPTPEPETAPVDDAEPTDSPPGVEPQPTPEAATPTPAPATPAPPTPAPPATTGTGATPPSVDAARAALRGGRYADAAPGFATQ
jgi:flagellar hook-length control protein FliK